MVHQLTKILKHFHTRGWRLVASADISAKFKKHGTKYVANDVHSWFFLHEPESVIMSDSIIKIEDRVRHEIFLSFKMNGKVKQDSSVVLSNLSPKMFQKIP